MKQYEIAFSTAMLANAPLNAILGSRIKMKYNMPPTGSDRATAPIFYSAKGRILTSAYIHAYDEMEAGGVRDIGANVLSVNVIVSVFLYDDGSVGFTNIDDAYALLGGLFNSAALSVGYVRYLRMPVRGNDPIWDNAAFIRASYRVIGIRG